jgi:hypothetical protein
MVNFLKILLLHNTYLMKLKRYYNLFGMVMSREWTQRHYQKLWFTGNLKEGNNEAIPREPGKMECIQPWMRDLRMGKWNNRRQWNMKVGRRHQTFLNRAIYIYIYIHKKILHILFKTVIMATVWNHTYYTRADRKVRFPYLLKINSNIYFQNQIHNMKA